MPSTSQKQRRKMGALRERGEISEKEWQHFKKVVPKKKGKK